MNVYLYLNKHDTDFLNNCIDYIYVSFDSYFVIIFLILHKKICSYYIDNNQIAEIIILKKIETSFSYLDIQNIHGGPMSSIYVFECS